MVALEKLIMNTHSYKFMHKQAYPTRKINKVIVGLFI
jgi:hypothetical protein